MKAGDLVKMKWRGNGHPGIGLIVSIEDGEYVVLWDLPEWSMARWRHRELEVINEHR
jgi:hypothetical protein